MAAKHHVIRSISLPSRSHPTNLRVEEELNRLQTSSSFNSTSDSICKSLKQVDNKIATSPLLEQDHHLTAVIRVLREVCVKNMSIFQSLLVFLAVPVSKPKSNKWSLVPKFMHKGVIACEDQKEHINGHEFDGVDAALCNICKSSTATFDCSNKRLEALEVTIEGLENGLESVFRRMIKTRASLLNIISQ